MASKILPRYLLLVSLLAVAVVAVMLSMFYGQYQWLATGIVETGGVEHELSIADSFENQSLSVLEKTVDGLAENGLATGNARLRLYLNRVVAETDELLGLEVWRDGAPVARAGLIEYDREAGPRRWRADDLQLAVEVPDDGGRGTILVGNFSLDMLQSNVAEFRNSLLQQENTRRQSSFAWIGIATLLALSFCGLTLWFIARTQSVRISNLIEQVEKLRDSDFGEPLEVIHGDDLGELADVFNQMRDQLQVTTISRNYVDRVLGSMNEAIIITEPDGAIARVNRATLRLLEYEEDELLGRSIDVIVDQAKGGPLEVDLPVGVPSEAFLISSKGKSIPVSYTGSIIGDNKVDGDRVYAAQNITERRKAEQRIRYLARIDALTKVPNRMQFQHLLQRAIADASRTDRYLCVLYVDIDRFKEVNDTFGHLAGDTTLETVAERLRDLQPADSIIGRLAGDEFAVVCSLDNDGDSMLEQANTLARKILTTLAEPFELENQEIFLTASIGMALYPIDANNVIDLIRNADAALYSAKKNGGNIFAWYKPAMSVAAVERLMTKSKLKRAFERDELLVHYQPKYNLKTGEVVGAEALVRWELPDRGIILPSDFIPIAEETSLIIEIGEWVLDRVCEDFRFWQRSVGNAGRLSVNLSLKQLRQSNFISRISSILRSYELSPTSLELEITETTLMEDPTRTIKLLDELYSLGLHLAIDDFGTGYSSLSALQQFPISTLKIDQSFVRHVATNADDATIVATIIHMGHSLQMDVVAEGVETEEQLNFLQSLDCTYAQGLLFGDPMSADNYLELLLSQQEGTDIHRALFA